MVAVSPQQLQQQQRQQQHWCNNSSSSSNNNMYNEQLQRRPHLRSRDKVIGLLCQKVFGV
ncbi:GD17151 [Drosophila simulans]|uniref:GD17151 n=1 Tax=Drosophila simulans TaxID=7240 RepID=B4R4L4_DROSI|nr:GD17151 [Drosophila simulans]